MCSPQTTVAQNHPSIFTSSLSDFESHIILKPSILNFPQPEFEKQKFSLTALNHSKEIQTSETVPWLILVSGSRQARNYSSLSRRIFHVCLQRLSATALLHSHSQCHPSFSNKALNGPNGKLLQHLSIL